MTISENQNVSNSFRKVLNRHGYAFQYSSVRIADELFSKGSFNRWIFQASEFPVEIARRNKGTRIDFILRSSRYPIYLLFECKRANPSIKNWCFAKAPYVRRNRTEEQFFVETIKSNNGEVSSMGMILRSLNQNESFHIALEVKSSEKGDNDGKGTGEIEDAAGQVCYGLNGMVELFHNYPLVEQGKQVVLVPIILTTANIWTSSVDLGAADINNGELITPQIQLDSKQWVYFQYHQSPGLKNSFSNNISGRNEIESILDREYIRTIPIVTANAISDFLQYFDDDLYNLREVY